MPRKARIDAPGALHHIIIRGIERKAIFKDNSDRDNFVERLGQIISQTDTGCYAWVLMTNHVHMLLKTGLAPIATVMRRLLTGYVLKSFDQSVRQARRAYESFVAQGIKHGRRLDLVGGGLLRSVGGWAELKEYRDLGIAVRKLGYKCSDVSKAMGVSAVTVSKAVCLGSELSEVDQIQKRMLDN